MATQTASSSSSSSWKYDVFLSFCGVDTRKNFTDHLYTALKQKGIVTFRDDEKLERGKYISLELLKAIEESKYAIIVLSSNYASSRWCLIELAKIVGCMKENRLTVLPVFHYVDPSDVRNQTGTLIEAFARHEKDPKINIQDVQEWKAALKEVGNISGWHLHDRILMAKEINIWDLRGGIDLIGNRLRNKKVLIVLDDVDGEKQLEALAGKHDWFALELFSWRAFKKPHPEENYVDLSKDFVNYTNGLPLALKVLGYNLDVLIDKSLIFIYEEGTLWMHDLLQDMGKEIVRRESPKEPGGRSRLWLYEDVLHVLKNNSGTEAVEGIMLNTPNEKEEHLSAEAFSKMKKLRLLKIGNLQLPHDLIRVEFPNLKQLILQRCTRLSKIHASLENLKRLITLDLRHCKNLSRLPNAICSLTSLKTLALSGCSKLDELPENLGNIRGLEELDVSGTAITRLPSSVVLLKNLKVLSLCGCEGLSSESSNNLLSFPLMRRRRPDPMSMLEHSLSSLWSLTELNLSYCNLQEIPDVFFHLSSLIELDLRGNNFVCLPKSIIQLSKLIDLDLSSCPDLRLLPELPLNIKYIRAVECTSLETLPIRPEDDFVPQLFLVNCLKLIENQCYDDVFLTMLRRFFRKEHSNQDWLHYHYLRKKHRPLDWIHDHFQEIPGSEIPKWFSHQKVGASMNLQVPSDLFYKCMGIAVCAVHVFRQHHPLDRLDFETHHVVSTVKVNGDELKSIGLRLSEKFGLEVTKCGAHLVYEEDLNQTMGGCSITPYEDDVDDSAKDNTDCEEEEEGSQ
uniref:TIR domain-containing protein n=1 Tax=Fagus sylvatica TaxID=28930 RepID=A0A2N9FWS0_FAGSY